jgi:hypothetical protein
MKTDILYEAALFIKLYMEHRLSIRGSKVLFLLVLYIRRSTFYNVSTFLLFSCFFNGYLHRVDTLEKTKKLKNSL